jgi:hypothetical protein
MKTLIRLGIVLALLAMVSCAGVSRGCASWWANNAGADWIIVQYAMDGKPINCWQYTNVSVTNEAQSDGIYWSAGHLVHISGWYNRVQVSNHDFVGGAKMLGIDLDRCVGGAYRAPATPAPISTACICNIMGTGVKSGD